MLMKGWNAFLNELSPLIKQWKILTHDEDYIS